MKMKKAANAKRLALALKRNGVEVIFGQSNPPHITLACMDEGIRQIGYRQENTGSYMAQGYGMCTGKVPVVTAQNGPAATLLVAGLAECLKASHPIVAIVQEVAGELLDKNAFQEMDHVKLFEGVSKWIRKIPCKERIEDYVDMAFIAAGSGKPGPAVLLCPGDIFTDIEEYPVNEARSASYGNYPIDRMTADPKNIEEAAKLLSQAAQPLVYAGGGVVSSGASEELRKLQQDFGLPVATSTMGKGAVDETHPLSMGPIGYYMGKRGRTKYMRPYIDGADVILLIGNRTNQNGTDSWTLLPEGAKYIHIDIDPLEVGRNYEALRVVGDAKLTLAALYEQMKTQDKSKRESTRAGFEKTIADAKAQHIKEAAEVRSSAQSPIRVERFLAEVEKQLQDDQIIVADASLSSVWLANYMTADKKKKFVFPRGIAGLGWGLPLAMGAKLASPNKKVFCLAGDGGFAHAWSELETCKREGIEVVIAIINNEVLSYQRLAELAWFDRYTNVCDLTPVNHAMIAEACGVKGIRVESAGEIEGALKQAFAHKGSVVLDVMMDKNCAPPVKTLEGVGE